MPKTTTTYYLLVSCPSDVKDELKIIGDKVLDFNRTFGEINGIKLEIKHWSKSSYPQSGGRPQELLNEQFVKDCDLAVAVFWTRFGTPTDKYGSGTEEEIELLISEGKQVFLYFSNAAINPENIDQEQYIRLKEFKKKYLDKGIFYAYDDIREFERNFLNHVSLHFLGLLDGVKDQTEKNQPNLILHEASEESRNAIRFYQSDFINSDYIIEKKEQIDNAIKSISEINLDTQVDKENDGIQVGEPFSESEALSGVKMNLDLTGFAKISNILGNFRTSVEISNEDKITIEPYIKKLGIEDFKQFCNLGNLEKSVNSMPATIWGGNRKTEYHGNDLEKEKQVLLRELIYQIKYMKAFEKYLTSLDSLYYIELMLSNCGDRFDEDIDIELRIEKGCICKLKELPIPQGILIDYDHSEFFSDVFFKLHDRSYAENYTDGELFNPLSSGLHLPIDASLLGKKYTDLEREVELDLESLFEQYKWFNNDEDIIQLKMGCLKHGKSMLFPSKLFFHKKPNYIKYIIKSKYQIRSAEGDLKLI